MQRGPADRPLRNLPRTAGIAAVLLLLAVSGLLGASGLSTGPSTPGPPLARGAPAPSAPAPVAPVDVAARAGPHADVQSSAARGAATNSSSPCPANATYSNGIDGFPTQGPNGANYSGLATNNSSYWISAWCFTQDTNPNGSITYCVYGYVGAGTNVVANFTPTCTLWLDDFDGVPCQPGTGNATIGAYGLNLSVVASPANGSGPSPLNLSWNASVGGISGGLPPYHYEVFVLSANFSFIDGSATGNVTLTEYGLYTVDVLAEDSTCTQSGFDSFTVQVYGPLGPHPVAIAATANSSTVPALVTYAVNTSALPANWSIQWDTPGIFSSPTNPGNSTWDAGNDANYSVYFPGSYAAEACFVQPDSVVYACGVSPSVVIGGAVPVTTHVTVAPGPYPTNVTYSVTLNPGVTLPSGTYLYLFADDVNGTGQWNESYGGHVTLTVAEACGAPLTPYVPTSGNCSWPAYVSLDGPLGGVDAGFLGGIYFAANLTAVGNASTWLPTLSLSYGPTNGTLPLNFTLNLTATNGVAPYYYSYTVFARTSGAANASFLPTTAVQAWGWNGSTLSFVLVFNHTGVYWVQVFVSDAEDHFVDSSLPLLVLGNVSPLRPLVVRPSLTGLVGIVAGGAEEFSVAVGGGVAPYTIQWAFGDGSYASSVVGATVSHTYTAPGTYTPSVTVTDARGRSVTELLPTISVSPATVTVPPTTAPSPNPMQVTYGGLSFAWVPVLAAAAVAAALTAVGLVQVRRERLRKEGERLLAEAGAADGSDPP